MDDPSSGNLKAFIEMFPRIIFLSIVILVFVFFAYYFIFQNIKTDVIEREVFVNRLLYSPDALAYYDAEIGRTYLGIIDLKKLNSTHLEKGIDYEENYFLAAKITLKGKDPVFFHEPLYEKLYPLAKAKVRGPGGADYELDEFMVSFYDSTGILRSEKLRIETLRARS